ncbi:MAG: ABC transporter permease [Sciscionella sp.]
MTQPLGMATPLEAPVRRTRVVGGLHTLRRTVLPFACVVAAWEAFVHLSSVNPALFPPVEVVARTFWSLLTNGILLSNAGGTLWRLGLGWVIAVVLSLVVGFLMARIRAVEEFVLPLISVLIPIPSIAWIPLFILWFGLGNTSVVILVIFSASLPMTLNMWTGMRSIRSIWLRAAESMGVSGYKLFRKVVLPGSLPFVMTGLRIGLAQAWRAVVAGEMIAATKLGLGIMIFNSREFLQTDVMLSALLVIGPVGFFLEKVLFQTVERRTIDRWGMTAHG